MAILRASRSHQHDDEQSIATAYLVLHAIQDQMGGLKQLVCNGLRKCHCSNEGGHAASGVFFEVVSNNQTAKTK